MGTPATLFALFIFSQNPTQARVSFCAVGDILLDRGIRASIQSNSVDYPFEHVSEFINDFDLAFCNLECPVSAVGQSTGKIYCFRADTSYFSGVQDAGFNLFSLANNHIIDWGEKACLDTKQLIEKNNLYVVGAGKDQVEAQAPLFIKMNGLKFAFLASVGIPLKDMIWPISKPGPAQANLEQLVELILKIRQSIDYIVVSLHWGTEYEHLPRSHQVIWAHTLINAGADLIIGHHPHVLQSIEYYNNRVILYSLGNFIFDQHKLYQRQSGIFSCIFKKGRIDSICFHPVLLQDFQPRLAQDTVFELIVQKINVISKKYNAVFLKTKNQLFITDSSCVLSIDTPIMRAGFSGKTILVTRNSIEMYDSNGMLIDTININKHLEIKDCCFIKDANTYRLFAIVGKVNGEFGDFISQFKFTPESIIPECCTQDIKHRPWKILTADIDCDSTPEICIGACKVNSLDKTGNRLLLYKWNGTNFYPTYTSSKNLKSFIDFTLQDIDNDGLDDLITLEANTDEKNRIIIYQWLGIGFSKYRDLTTDVEDNWLCNIDIESLISNHYIDQKK